MKNRFFVEAPLELRSQWYSHAIDGECPKQAYKTFIALERVDSGVSRYYSGTSKNKRKLRKLFKRVSDNDKARIICEIYTGATNLPLPCTSDVLKDSGIVNVGCREKVREAFRVYDMFNDPVAAITKHTLNDPRTGRLFKNTLSNESGLRSSLSAGENT